jgi:hypothetical protein
MRSVLDMESEATSEALTTVKDSVTGARILSLLKENRLELIALTILVHVLGLSDRALAHLNGVCF